MPAGWQRRLEEHAAPPSGVLHPLKRPACLRVQGAAGGDQRGHAVTAADRADGEARQGGANQGELGLPAPPADAGRLLLLPLLLLFCSTVTAGIRWVGTAVGVARYRLTSCCAVRLGYMHVPLHALPGPVSSSSGVRERRRSCLFFVLGTLCVGCDIIQSDVVHGRSAPRPAFGCVPECSACSIMPDSLGRSRGECAVVAVRR